jgi:hypothetical protein
MRSAVSDEISTQSPQKRRRTDSQEYGFMRNRDGHDSAHFLGSGSGIYFIQNVSSLLAKNSATIRQEWVSPVEDVVPGEDDRLPGRDEILPEPRQIWDASEITGQNGEPEHQAAIAFEDLVGWTKSYFETWHPAFPFLHAPTILSLLEQISNRGFSSISQANAIIVRSIVSISTCDARQALPHTFEAQRIPKCLVFGTIKEALCCLDIALYSSASVLITQAAVSVQLFLVSMLHFNSASRIGGLVVRMAFQLGLHRCPSRFSTFSTLEKQIRRRLFWSLYCIERHLCQSLGLPLEIRDDDVDVCYPGEEQHCGEDESEDTGEGRLQL